MANKVIPLIRATCIDGKKRLKKLEGIYCVHYKFSRDLMDGGCCFGSKKYSACVFVNPTECENFELKRGCEYA